MKLKMNDMMRKLSLRMQKPRSDSILYNRFVLYALFVVALVNLYVLSVSRNYTYVVVFVLVGFLTTFFSKNMIVILFVAIAITNLFQLGLSNSRFEGYEGKNDKDTSNDKDDESESDKKVADTPTPDSKSSEKSKDEKIKAKKEQIIEDGKELLDVQAKIVDGFQQIEPYMEKAGSLASEIENSAKTIDKLNNGR